MTPLKIIFEDESFILIFSNNPEAVVQSANHKSSVIYEIQEVRPIPETTLDNPIEECTITFSDGLLLKCSMLRNDIHDARFNNSILDCERTFNTEINTLSVMENVLDNRLQAAYAVVNHLPNKKLRLTMHKEYLKLKGAYVSAMEAMLDRFIHE